jgi:hypothetical protein
MRLRDKFNETTNCNFRSTCRNDADNVSGRSLFERDWEVFVIKRDPATGKYSTNTLCCEQASSDADSAGYAIYI